LILNNRIFVFVFVFLTLIIGGFASSQSLDIWYVNLVKSDLNPPGYIFGIVWPILYLLMSIAAYRTFEITKNPFFIQLIFNAMWSWLFFFFQMPFIALINIWLLIYLNTVLTIKMYKLDKFSGLIYVPYVIWLLFASYLNLFIVINN
jgi:tryptophan-rich sensory protein|tara:strand:+ start:91 stop:531 length:441 start_codon:yes stop_codon:yes gene_type:complete